MKSNSSEGVKGLSTATGSFFLNPSGYKELPGKFIGHDTAMVMVVERRKQKKDSIHEILKMQVS